MGETALIPIPTNLTPPTNVCYQFEIPDDSQWKGMFWGALYMLTVWGSYDRDDAHTGAVMADAWKAIVNAARASTCGGAMSIQFRQTGCLLEFSLDSGATWSTAYNGATCIAAKIADGTILGGSAIDDALAAGKLAGGNQQGPTPPPAVGFCKSFFVTLSANQKWICPTPINGNYVITIEQVQGGWVDNPATIPWFCPSGKTYALGFCVADVPAEAGDPLMSVNHMRLVGNYGATWFDAFNTTHQVPTSVTTDQQLYLQANDSDLTNNLGSCSFKITVCRATWIHVFDFTIDEQGWVPLPLGGGQFRAQYVAGVGWVKTSANLQRDTILIDTPSSFDIPITEVQVRVADCAETTSIGIVYGPVSPYQACTGGGVTFTETHNANRVTIDVTCNDPQTPTIIGVTLKGLGLDPWA